MNLLYYFRSVFTAKNLAPKIAAKRRLAAFEALENRRLFSVTAASIAPTSSLAIEGATVAFNLNATSDQGDATTWNINWGDGSKVESLGTGLSSVSHVFSVAGNYLVTATA